MPLSLGAAALIAGGSAAGGLISGLFQNSSANRAVEAAEREGKRKEALGREGLETIKGSLGQSLGDTAKGRSALQLSSAGAQRTLRGAEGELRDFRTGELPGMFQQERDAGASALQRLQDVILGGDMSQLQIDPGFAFRQAEGNKAIERAAAAAGSFGGGANLKDFSRFNQGLASQEFGNAVNRLSGLQQIGSQANRSLAGLQSSLLGQQTGIAGQRAGVQQNLGLGLANSFQNDAQLRQSNATGQANVLQGIAADPTALQAIQLQAQAGHNLGTTVGNTIGNLGLL